MTEGTRLDTVDSHSLVRTSNEHACCHKLAIPWEVLPPTTTTTTAIPVRHLAKPPKCAGPPPKMTRNDVAMALAPFKPAGTRDHVVDTKDGGSHANIFVGQLIPLQD